MIYKKYPYPYNLMVALTENESDGMNVLDDDRIAGLEYALSTLTERQRTVCKMRFEDEMTYEQIAKRFEVTRERIRQILAKTIRELRHPSRFKYIQLGFEIASGKLEAQMQARQAEELERLMDVERRRSEVRNILDRPVKTLGLSVRAFNCLWRDEIKTVERLMTLEVDDIKRMRCAGRKTLSEILGAQERIKRELEEVGE